ncbi:type II toxin-antitoxin system RelE/ParE family toxin [Nocardia puris]|uniref:type II toxin-antitoxin system RelE family toxin n=1 Tax=Nocardia puris TaxID=208602 RepID=UPI0018955158|nr:type II toxin-antitoxin system RelE/ParE family toxin [Nocardia puris]MBF6213538.1 type II toxin-antitoxin system RelE/ParE family toxin [Nocardia puris]MBF6365532.1 type II toxin-antitoxin system RelE/ParE family toxin [Nocardia puris]MBF6459998.1 type II toxin-antitoxin system RelE/ParE family toxin [Nocardia puris]
MKYRFHFTDQARRELRAIERYDAMRVLTALTALGNDPYAPGLDVKKLAGREDLYRLRVGRYRVAYRVDNGVLVILIVKVGWRKDVYRGL